MKFVKQPLLLSRRPTSRIVLHEVDIRHDIDDLTVHLTTCVCDECHPDRRHDEW